RDAARSQRVRGRGVATRSHGGRQGHRRGRPPPQRHGGRRHPRAGRPRRRAEEVSDPSLGLTMLGLIVAAIMMGYPTAFTLMGLGLVFGFIAFWTPGGYWWQNRIFDLVAQRTYGVRPTTRCSRCRCSSSWVTSWSARRWWIACSTACSSRSGASRLRWL